MRLVSICLCYLTLSGLGKKGKYQAPIWSSPTPETYTRAEDRFLASDRPWGSGPSEEELHYISLLKDLEEMSKMPCAEIEGIIELPGVSAYTSAKEVAFALGAGPFKYAFRHNESTQAIKPIIVVFDTYKAQDVWLRAARRKKTMHAHMINGKLPPGRVYVCELLSPLNKLLLVQAKNFSKVRNFKAVWSHRGGVFLRRTGRTRVYRILNTFQLRNVVNGVY